MEQKIKDVEKWYDKNKALYEQFSKDIEEIITKILKTKNIPYQSVCHRVKEKESYLNKSRNEKYTNPIEQITDMSGIRIISYTNQDVLSICKILRDEFCIDKNNSENKADILETDKVGYLSIHYILQLSEKRLGLSEYKVYENLKCEVQVRTLLQHAWAEIEHDRNYKFAGVLPNEIKRRFYLVAGVLELMDCEFDKLSKDIDEYVKNMKKAVSKGDYNLGIDSKSVEQYMLKRFDSEQNLQSCDDGTIISEKVVEELVKFGYKTIQEIEDDLNSHEIVSERKNTYIGLLRDLMIIKDCKKYFDVAYNGHWQGTSNSKVKFWKKNGAEDVERFLFDYGIMVE
ncbi:MAG: hypothetical protein HDQ98_11350 [Lachnospiraceae bacterium]|nr:hypothetical protein [Lachnospiraceae bacterium]